MISQESGSESPNVGSSDYSGDTEPVASDNEEEIQQKEHTVSDKQEEMQQKEHTEPVTSNNEEEKQKGDDEEEKDKSRECKHVGQDNEQLDNQKSTITDPSLDKQEKDDTNVVKSKTKNSQTTSVRQHSDSGSSDDDVSWSRPWLKWQVSHFYNSMLSPLYQYITLCYPLVLSIPIRRDSVIFCRIGGHRIKR